MKKLIKIKDTTFEFELPDIASEMIMMEWMKRIDFQNQHRNNPNEWVTLDFLPQYRFKGLKVQQFMRTDEKFNNELTITFFCDEFQNVDNISDIKRVSKKLSHSEDRFPYAYHHDYILCKDKFTRYKSISVISELKNWTEEELYATALSQILEESGVIKVLNSLDQDDMDICRKALRITDEYINKTLKEDE